jgi:glycosyltransferase involved in cell wall biosynthesis
LTLKILQMVRTLDPSTGGVVRAVLLLSGALARAGHQVEIVSLDLPDSPWLDATESKGWALGASRSGYGYSASLMRWLRAEGGRFDHVIVNGIWQYHSFAAWRRYAGSPIPYYVFPHGMLDPWFRRTYPLKHLKKWLYWPWADYRVLRDASAVIFTSEQERIEARKSFWLYRCRERVSPLGVEPPDPIHSGFREFFLEKYPALRNTRILLFLGRLHLKKGCDLLLDALAHQRNSGEPLSLVLAGPDQEGWAERLRAQSARLALSFPIILTGMLEGATKTGAFEAADAFILPSHQENFGLSVVEALAAGVPVLISNCVNIWREIDADGAGYVESDDLAGTTRLIERWIQTSPPIRDTMRQNAKKCFARRFEIRRAADSLLEVLREPRN